MQRARESVKSVAGAVLEGTQANEAAVLAWPLVCGLAVAARTRALEFDAVAGELRVEVPDAAWRAQLSDLGAQYAAAMNDLINQRVERIRFVLPPEQGQA